MTTGIVFDIREFTIHDGPGIRTTVFLKGCPLACSWCHNPEGLDPVPQVMRSSTGDRSVGRRYAASELADLLGRQASILASNEGGVTFSGGEPLSQAAFVADVVDRLPGVHVVLDTSGFGRQHAFIALARRANLVYFDLKVMEPTAHRRWTGQDNASILRNLALLAELRRPFVARVPLVPGVTDTFENLTAIAAAVASQPTLLRVELLPYNRAAGGKYAVRSAGRRLRGRGPVVRRDPAPGDRLRDVLPLARPGTGRRAAGGAGRGRDGRRAAARRPVRGQSRPDARNSPSGTDQRPPVLRRDRLPPRLQRRTDHAGAGGLGVP